MPSLRSLFLSASLTLLGAALSAQTTAPTAATPAPAAPAPIRVASTGGNSLHETTSAVIGDRRTGNRVTLTYGRPARTHPRTGEVRTVWGVLVPWDQPWRLGSDEATTLITQRPLHFGTTVIPAGAHTLYMVPAATGPSQLVFSTNLGKWGTPVDTTTDRARVDLTQSATDTLFELLTLKVENDPATGGGLLRISWENTQFTVPFTVGQ